MLDFIWDYTLMSIGLVVGQLAVSLLVMGIVLAIGGVYGIVFGIFWLLRMAWKGGAS